MAASQYVAPASPGLKDRDVRAPPNPSVYSRVGRWPRAFASICLGASPLDASGKGRTALEQALAAAFARSRPSRMSRERLRCRGSERLATARLIGNQTVALTGCLL